MKNKCIYSYKKKLICNHMKNLGGKCCPDYCPLAKKALEEKNWCFDIEE